jgi:hypothetical protein
LHALIIRYSFGENLYVQMRTIAKNGLSINAEVYLVVCLAHKVYTNHTMMNKKTKIEVAYVLYALLTLFDTLYVCG